MKQLKTVALGFVSFLVISALIGGMIFLVPGILGTVAARRDCANQEKLVKMRMIRESVEKSSRNFHYPNCITNNYKKQDNTHENEDKINSNYKLDLKNTRPPQSTQIYDIKSGDNLCGISKTYGVAVDEIVSHNQIKNPDLIREGSALVIPAKAE